MVAIVHGGLDCTPSFEEHVLLMTAALEGVEARSQNLAQLVALANKQCAASRRELEAAADEARQLRTELAAARSSEKEARHEAARLQALLEAAALHGQFRTDALEASLAEERARTAALRAARDAAVDSRDEAIADLAVAYADIEALQATLADSAQYVRVLRLRVADMETAMLQQRVRSAAAAAAAAQQQQQQQQQQRDQQERGVFSLTAIRAAIQTAVADAARCDEDERRRRIRALQLRWHPDKNPVLQEFATEVTKLINTAVTEMERGEGGGG